MIIIVSQEFSVQQVRSHAFKSDATVHNMKGRPLRGIGQARWHSVVRN